MGREVEEDRVEEMSLLPHQVRSHVWFPGMSPPLVECCQQLDRRQGYTLQWWFIGTRIKCSGLLKNTLLTNHAAGWRCKGNPAHRSSVLTWPCMRALVVVPEIDWHASMRATESLAIPFEHQAHTDRAIHWSKHRFPKAAYANRINRLCTSQVQMQKREHIRKEHKTRESREGDLVWSRKQPQLCSLEPLCGHDHKACCKLSSYPSMQHVTSSLLRVHTLRSHWPLVVSTGNQDSVKRPKMKENLFSV